MSWTNGFLEFIENNYVSLILTLGLTFLFFIGRAITNRMVKLHAKRNHVRREREIYIRKLIHIILVLLLLSAIGAAWEISLKGLSLYFASIFTILGVALFANWSLLSNLTASIILFFFFPFRIGHKVKILDGDNSQVGKIVDISLFYVKIILENKDTAVIPNNIVIQKVIIQLQSS